MLQAKYIWAIVLCSCMWSVRAQPPAGEPSKGGGGIWLPAIIYEGDTLAYDYLDPVYKSELLDPSRKHYIDRLRYNVFKVYPYAILAAGVLKKMDQDLGHNPSKRERKKYLETLDLDLNNKFKDELKDLSVTQGKILVKLVNRQTGRNCYDIIKELKGGANARFYQTAFKFVDNDLKTQYDPFGEDKDIEMIVREIETNNYIKPQTIQVKSR